jgi:hypothetical protein
MMANNYKSNNAVAPFHTINLDANGTNDGPTKEGQKNSAGNRWQKNGKKMNFEYLNLSFCPQGQEGMEMDMTPSTSAFLQQIPPRAY